MDFSTKLHITVTFATVIVVLLALALGYKQKGKISIIEVLIAFLIVIATWFIVRPIS